MCVESHAGLYMKTLKSKMGRTGYDLGAVSRALSSRVLGSHWRVLSRGVTQSGLCFGWQEAVALLKREAEAGRTERRRGLSWGRDGEKRWSLKTVRWRESLCCPLAGV